MDSFAYKREVLITEDWFPLGCGGYDHLHYFVIIALVL